MKKRISSSSRLAIVPFLPQAEAATAEHPGNGNQKKRLFRGTRGVSLAEVMVTMTLVILLVTVVYSALMIAGRLSIRYTNRYTATCQIADILECYKEPGISFEAALSFYGKSPSTVSHDGITSVYLFEETEYTISVTVTERETSYDFIAIATLRSNGSVLYEYSLYRGVYQ